MKLALIVATAITLMGCGGSGNSVGGTCAATDDCGDGLTCNTAVPGGYCTRSCLMTGETSECPQGSVCDTVEGTITCIQICDTSADCREGLDCNGVSGSNLKGCKPVEGNHPDAGLPDAA